MAYEKNVWACGDEITAEKLNHIEEGIEGLDMPIFHYVSPEDTASADMYAFVTANKDKPFCIYDDEIGLVQTIVNCATYPEENHFSVDVLSFDGEALHLYTYAPDAQHPEMVNRGDYVVWGKQ